MPDLVTFYDGEMFMWDGKEYEQRAAALASQTAYEKDGFQTRLADEGGKCLVYTRRLSAQQTAAETA